MKYTLLSLFFAFASVVFAANPKIEIIFDKTPVEKGMSFTRTYASPLPESTDEICGWSVRRGADPKRGWVRILELQVTDERFRNGAMPVVDIEIEYQHTANSSFEALADTARGMVRGSGRFGAAKDWRILKFRLDDARFAGQGPNGSDLRLLASNNDWGIRRITITGYPLEEEVDFSRLLRFNEVRAKERSILYFEPGEEVEIFHGFSNLARMPFSGSAQFEVIAHQAEAGKLSRVENIVVFTDKKDFSAEKSSNFDLAFRVPAKGYLKGVYDTRLTLFDKSGKQLFERAGSFGIGNRSTLPKAKEYEFMYGLDCKLGPITEVPEIMDWLAILGTDIVRLGVNPNRLKETYEQIDLIRKNGMKVLALLDVSKAESYDTFKREQQKLCVYAATLARDKKIVYWELGNEPDLPFFFPAGMERYLEGAEQLAAAIRKENPNTVIVNGGLANASHRPESGQRVNDFFRLVKPKTFSRVAYHAHGAGGIAEKNACQKMWELSAKYGKAGVPFVDTETGVAANGPRQEMTQAITCVQKFLFTQRKHHPYMIWFRLLFEQVDSYGSLRSPREPRPVILAYRNLVETLRGYKYDDRLIMPDGEALIFQKCDDPTQKVAILSTERDVSREIRLDLDTDSAPGSEPELFDLFGNRFDPESYADGILSLTIEKVPCYLRWKTSKAHESIKIVNDAFVNLCPAARLQEVGLTHFEFKFKSPFSFLTNVNVRITDASLTSNSLQFLDLTNTRKNSTLSFNSDSKIIFGNELKLSIFLEPNRLNVGRIAFCAKKHSEKTFLPWPDVWLLFADLPERQDLKTITQRTNVIAGVKGVPVLFEDNRLKFDKLLGFKGEKSAVLLLTELEAPEDMTVKFGAGADWWMTWAVNGEIVYTTEPAGNGSGFSYTDHVFPVKLKKGKNLIAVEILSGSQGWQLVTASPEVVACTLAGRNTPEAFKIEVLDDNGKPLLQKTFDLQREKLRNIWTPGISKEKIETIIQLPPSAVLSGDAVKNLHVTEPDKSKWWQGDKDFSARVWTAVDGDCIVALLEITDDKLLAKKEGSAHDKLRIKLVERVEDNIRISADKYGDTWEFTYDPEKNLFINSTFKPNIVPSIAYFDTNSKVIDGKQYILLKLCPKNGNPAAFKLSFQLEDCDADELKQTISRDE